MKKVILLAIILTLCVGYASAQKNVFGNVYYSTAKENSVGGEVAGVLGNGFVIGVGGSHATSTYNGTGQTDKDGNTYDEGIRLPGGIPNASGFPSNQLIRPTDEYKRFNEVQGAVKVLLGYNFQKSKTIIVADLGIAMRREYLLGKGTGIQLQNPNPDGYYFTYNPIDPAPLYGVSVMQSVAGRLGMIVGYNNIEGVKLGISYRITPTTMFKD